ncbi:uncharacterized protein B0P05DRAFT_573732 [Gilbertella persicaria]|uniref:uncharacterized protein n=1 Tax=Gilbertella persicaria TaxID=101096 RepID=UPI00221FF804|nr:uncharacterized protein B0P05DRAFT_573732 [Gilbertella persicaria]KAI8067675.1 hypothetical protein B0P05DRAFT_573732 [Gilbertella persicaria]
MVSVELNDNEEEGLIDEANDGDLEIMVSEAIKCEEDLSFGEIVKQTTFFSVVIDSDRRDVTAEDIKKDIPNGFERLLCNQPEGVHEDKLSVSTDSSYLFSFDINDDDFVMMDEASADVTRLCDSISSTESSSSKNLETNFIDFQLNPNNSSSYFIDAPFDLLVRCVTPYIKNSFIDACEDVSVYSFQVVFKLLIYFY